MTWVKLNIIFGGWKAVAAVVANAVFIGLFKLNVLASILGNKNVGLILVALILFAVSYKAHFIFCPTEIRGIKSFEGYFEKFKGSVTTKNQKSKFIAEYSLTSVTEHNTSRDIIWQMFKVDDNKNSAFRIVILITLVVSAIVFLVVDIWTLYDYASYVVKHAST